MLNYYPVIEDFAPLIEYSEYENNYFSMILPLFKQLWKQRKNLKSYRTTEFNKYWQLPSCVFTSSVKLFLNNFCPVYHSMCSKLGFPPLVLGKSYVKEIAEEQHIEIKVLENYYFQNFWTVLNKILILSKA